MSKVSINLRFFLVAWLALCVASVSRPSTHTPKDGLHHCHPVPPWPPLEINRTLNHFKSSPSTAFPTLSPPSPSITWLISQARTTVYQRAYGLAGKVTDSSQKAFGKLTALLSPYKPGSLGHRMRMVVLWILTPAPSRTISPLSTQTKSNYPAIPTPGHFWSVNPIVGNTTELLTGFTRLVHRCPVDSHHLWSWPSVQESLELLLLIVSCVATLPIVFAFIRTSWEDLDDIPAPGSLASSRVRPAVSVPQTFYGLDVADAFADVFSGLCNSKSLDEPFNAGSFVDIWSSSDDVSATQSESELDTSPDLTFRAVDTENTTPLDGGIARAARWIDMVGMDVQIAVRFLLPGRLDQPVLYISEGFIPQELATADPEWEENLLNEVLALEQSGLEWLGLDLTGARVEVMIDTLIGCYGAYIDCSGVEYEYSHEVGSRCMTFVVEFGSRGYSNAPRATSVGYVGHACEPAVGADQRLAITYPQLPLERTVFTQLGIHAVYVSDSLFDELLLGAKQTTLRELASTTPWYARLIEWVPPTSNPVEADATTTVEQKSTTWARPQRTARPGRGLYRPPRLQASLTEERRAERARERQEALDRLERENKKETEKTEEAEEVEGAESHKKTRRGKRGGKQAREWTARHEKMAQAAREYVRGEKSEGMD